MPLVPSYIETLAPYQAGRSAADVCREYGLERAVKLGSNENPLGPSPHALRAISAALSTLGQYPSGGKELRTALAARFGVRPENVITGSGSEGILSNIIRTFLCDGDEVLMFDDSAADVARRNPSPRSAATTPVTAHAVAFTE